GYLERAGTGVGGRPGLVIARGHVAAGRPHHADRRDHRRDDRHQQRDDGRDSSNACPHSVGSPSFITTLIAWCSHPMTTSSASGSSSSTCSWLRGRGTSTPASTRQRPIIGRTCSWYCQRLIRLHACRTPSWCSMLHSSSIVPASSGRIPSGGVARKSHV